MSHIVLYRKYRPKTFSEVIGQEHIVKTITNEISENKIAHAYLFCGPKGSGKTTMARLLAKAINCENRKKGEYEPCNRCSNCIEINEGKSLDLIEIDAASNRGIDEIRDLKENVKFQSVKLKYKVFIIDEAHQLTKEAANALLKILEEPPAFTVFVLATTEPQKMIPTIISRCQRFDFRRLKASEILNKLERILKEEGIKYNLEALKLIANFSTGAVRNAESILDQIISFIGKDGQIKRELVEKILGIPDTFLIIKFVNLLSQKKTKEAIEYLNEVYIKGIEPDDFLQNVIDFIREMLILKIDANLENLKFSTQSDEIKKLVLELNQKFSVEDLKRILQILISAELKTKYTSILQLPFELAIIEICEEK
ncbi:MAG: DNA polymerase III subunit gamma/tau [Minisyncoccia bacterium]